MHCSTYSNLIEILLQNILMQIYSLIFQNLIQNFDIFHISKYLKNFSIDASIKDTREGRQVDVLLSLVDEKVGVCLKKNLSSIKRKKNVNDTTQLSNETPYNSQVFKSDTSLDCKCSKKVVNIFISSRILLFPHVRTR